MKKLSAILMMCMFAATHVFAAALSMAPSIAEQSETFVLSAHGIERISADYAAAPVSFLTEDASGECCDDQTETRSSRASLCAADCAMASVSHHVDFPKIDNDPASANLSTYRTRSINTVFRPPIS